MPLEDTTQKHVIYHVHLPLYGTLHRHREHLPSRNVPPPDPQLDPGAHLASQNPKMPPGSDFFERPANGRKHSLKWRTHFEKCIIVKCTLLRGKKQIPKHMLSTPCIFWSIHWVCYTIFEFPGRPCFFDPKRRQTP